MGKVKYDLFSLGIVLYILIGDEKSKMHASMFFDDGEDISQ